jgi:DHA2 family multidrug resistance protein-like MFS transporter
MVDLAGSLRQGTPGEVAQTLAGALAAANELPAPEGTALTVAAREAFTHSFVIAESIGAALLVFAAGAFTILRKPAARRGMRGS